MAKREKLDWEVEKEEKVAELMKQLVDATNTMTSEAAVADGIVRGLLGSHRTLQQSFFRAFQHAMKEYSKADTDARNEQSVAFAKKVAEMDHYFPFI